MAPRGHDQRGRTASNTSTYEQSALIPAIYSPSVRMVPAHTLNAAKLLQLSAEQAAMTVAPPALR